MVYDDHVRRLWRHRGTTLPTPRRGPRQQLDLDELLAAGIEIADDRGLAAVSTRSIAARFGKTPMALYPYVGTKENLLALMQDQASALPSWPDPGPDLAADLQAWALALFALYLRHPWLASRPWSQATQGPNEQDWLERLLQIFQRWKVRNPAAITILYATVRSCAETAAAYETIDPAQWLAVHNQLPDLRERYPLSTSLEPVSPDWREAPRAAVIKAVEVLARGMSLR